jgi:uncharacterized protein YbjT (DUF2867 family)
MKIEIEHERSCLGAAGGSGRLIVRDALATGHSIAVLLNQKPILALTARLPPNAEVERRFVRF